MSILGKVFGVLVLVLSLAIGFLSWQLFEQRKVFRAHSEALAEGLMRVANDVKNKDGVDVTGELAGVTYGKAPDGGKESGTLGFEDYRKNSGSVNTAVGKLLEALNKRQEQMELFAQMLEDTGKAMSIDESLGVNKQNLLTDEQYQAKLNSLSERTKQVMGRDEAVRKMLADVARKVGADEKEVETATYRKCARKDNKYTIATLFTEIGTALDLSDAVKQAYLKSMVDFRDAVVAFDKWNFSQDAIARAEEGYRLTSKAADDEGEAARKKFMSQFKDKLTAFRRDAEALNSFIQETIKSRDNLDRKAADYEVQVQKAEEERDRLRRENQTLQKENAQVRKDYEWAVKVHKEMQLAKKLNEPAADDLSKEVVGGLNAVKSDFSCEIRRVEEEDNFVIISANNRQVCPGTRLIVVNNREGGIGKALVKLLVKECTDHLSKAYVLSGDVKTVNVGDRVELSVEHAEMVEREAEQKVQAEEARLRAARAEEDRKAREAIERRKEAERKANGDEFGL